MVVVETPCRIVSVMEGWCMFVGLKRGWLKGWVGLEEEICISLFSTSLLKGDILPAWLSSYLESLDNDETRQEIKFNLK
jgi:hypothetical protein